MLKFTVHLKNLEAEPWYVVWKPMAQHHSLVGRDKNPLAGLSMQRFRQLPQTQMVFEPTSVSPIVSQTHRSLLPENTVQDRHINKYKSKSSEGLLFFLCLKCLFSSCHSETDKTIFFTSLYSSVFFLLCLIFIACCISSLSLSSATACLPSSPHTSPRWHSTSLW